MANKKVKLIYNPNADMGNAWRRAGDLRPVIDEFGGADWAGTVYPTHGIDLARTAAEEGYELILAVGGDGTVHEVVNGVMKAKVSDRPPIGVVPMGSGNDFAHSIDMDMNPPIALRQVLTGEVGTVDVGLLMDDRGREEYFDNTVNIGFGGIVNYRSHSLPFLRGFLMYLVAVLQTIILNHDPVPMKVTMDSGDWEDEMIMLAICNGAREGGGFLTGPNAKNDDGLLDYTGVTNVSRGMMFRLVPEFMKGTQLRFKQVTTGRFKTMKIDAKKPLVLHADGESFAGLGTNVNALSFEIFTAGLKVIKPPKS